MTTTNNTATKRASNGRNALPTPDMGILERTVENKFPFELEFGENSILVKVVSDDGPKAPFLVTKEQRGKVSGEVCRAHGILNAISAIWENRYPIFVPGYYYLHGSLDEVRNTLGNNNVGYIKGGDMLRQDVTDGDFAMPPHGVKDAIWYRIHWDNSNFSLWEVKEIPFAEGEMPWVTHDRNSLVILRGLEDVYKAVALGTSLRLHMFDEIAYLMDVKIQQYNCVLTGDFDGLKELLSTGVAKAAQKNHYRYLAANPEKVARSIEKYGQNVKIKGNGIVDAAELVGHDVAYWRAGKRLIVTSINANNFQVAATVIQDMNYEVEIIK